MSPELRGAFHRELDKLELALATLLGLVPDAIQEATAVLLTGDADLSASVARWRQLVDELYADVDGTVEVVMARQAPVARDLRFLMCCVRVIPEVRDAVELIGGLGEARGPELAGHLSSRMRQLLMALGDMTAATWSAVDRLWRDGEVEAFGDVGDRDEALSDTHSSLVAEVAAGLRVDEAIEMALVMAAYERLGRHAGAIARLVEPIMGNPPPEAQ